MDTKSQTDINNILLLKYYPEDIIYIQRNNLLLSRDVFLYVIDCSCFSNFGRFPNCPEP